MAELILSPIADKIIGGLGSAAVQQVAQLWGINAEVDQLQETISTIKAVLLDAEKKQAQNHQLRNWLQELEDAVYEADDLMDSFEAEFSRLHGAAPAGDSTQVCGIWQKFAFRFKMSRRISDIKTKLDRIAKNRFNFQLDARDEEAQVVATGRERETHSFVNEEQIVGREKDKENILDALLGDKSFKPSYPINSITIVGMGGLGKTTLAQLVFNDKKVKERFEQNLWVCVSEVFEVKEIVRQIIKSATNKNPEDLDMDQLVHQLRTQISGRRFLLVLDDVWNENREKWLELEGLLGGGGEGSRILITTRSKKVGEIAAHKGVVYPLGTLDSVESWSLFEKVAFKQGQVVDESIRMRLNDILGKCDGVPLAIRAIGSMLYSKNMESRHLLMTEYELLNISPIKDERTKLVLKLSYDHLPSHLKHCFSYCSIFPKNYTFDVRKLINLWMAQGFLGLSSNSGEYLENVGRGYFNELLSRSFIQKIVVPESDNRVIYKMHDLMHDLAKTVAGSKCAVLGSIEDKIDKTTHHVSFEFNLCSSKQISGCLVHERKVRTILSSNLPKMLMKKKSSIMFNIFSAIVLNFKFLRTLDLKNSGLALIPNSICNLTCLRYLDLSYNHFKKVPNSITKLVNLLSLDLSNTGIEAIPNDVDKLKMLKVLNLSSTKLKKLPDSITKLKALVVLCLFNCKKLEVLPVDLKKLVNLMDLVLDDCQNLTHIPHGVSQLTSLMLLTSFPVSGNSEAAELSELRDLNNLGGHLAITKLKHRGNQAVKESEEANLKAKKFLKELVLSWEEVNVGILESVDIVAFEKSLESLWPPENLRSLSLEHYGGIEFPSWFNSLTYLEFIGLNKCLSCKCLPPLSQFNLLRELALHGLTSLEYISSSAENERRLYASTPSLTLFPSLKILSLTKLPKLKGWWMDSAKFDATIEHEKSPPFPALFVLTIAGCPKLTTLPVFPRLTMLNLINTSNWNPAQMKLVNFQRDSQEASSSSASLSFIASLTDLSIQNNKEIESLPPWIQSLNSLEFLKIENCAKMKNLSSVLQYLTSLRALDIISCCELDMCDDTDPDMWKPLANLKEILLFALEKLEALPEGIQYLSNLEVIRIWDCNKLKEIPEWISNLKSLQKLSIWTCGALKSLPEGIKGITSLKKLRIRNCPELSKRCQKDRGEDWKKIAHIQDLLLEEDAESEQPASSGWLSLKKFGRCYGA